MTTGSLQHDNRTPSVWHPRDLTEAWGMKRLLEGDGAVYVAGGTLLRMQWESGQLPMSRHLINLGAIPGLAGVAAEERTVKIGALTTLGECRRDPLLQRHHPRFVEAIGSIAAHSVRNQATIGGNILSRVGDSLPFFMVCEAEFEWHTGLSYLAEDASEWVERLHVQMPKASHLLTAVRLPYAREGEAGLAFTAYRKVGQREALTPSLVTIAVGGLWKTDGTLKRIAIAAGGGQTIPHRLGAVEKLLKGEALTRKLLREARKLITLHYIPRPDALAPDEYRKQTAARLIVAELWKASEAQKAGRRVPSGE